MNENNNNADPKNTPAFIPQRAGGGLGVKNNTVVTKNPPPLGG